METINIASAGPIGIKRAGNAILFSLNDILDAFDARTQPCVVAARLPSQIMATHREGKRIIYWVDAAAACYAIATQRGRDPAAQIKAMSAIIATQRANQDGADSIQLPRQLTHVHVPGQGRRPDGITVSEAIRQLAPGKKIAPAPIGKQVAERYHGEAEKYGTATIYQDAEQLLGIVSSILRRRAAN